MSIAKNYFRRGSTMSVQPATIPSPPCAWMRLARSQSGESTGSSGCSSPPFPGGNWSCAEKHPSLLLTPERLLYEEPVGSSWQLLLVSPHSLGGVGAVVP